MLAPLSYTTALPCRIVEAPPSRFSTVPIGAGLVLGAIIGALLGALSPDLMQLFLGRDVGVGDPVKTGTALGLLNGAIYGFFGGVVIVIAGAIVARKRGDG